MALISLDVAPKTIEATTVATLQAESPALASASASLLTRLAREATEAIESALGDGRTPRRLARARVTETVRGNNRSLIRLSRVPVLSIDALALDGAAQDATKVKITDPERGEVWLEALWQVMGADLELRGGWTEQPRPLWAITYTAGWLMPGDDVSTTVSAAASDDSFNDSASGFPALVRAGDWIEAEGFTGANAGFHKVTGTPTTAKVVTATAAIADEVAGATKVLRFRSLPREIERCAIDLVRGLYLARTRDPAVKREEWSGTAVEFAALASDAPATAGMIRRQLAQWCAPRPGLASHELVRA